MMSDVNYIATNAMMQNFGKRYAKTVKFTSKESVQHSHVPQENTRYYVIKDQKKKQLIQRRKQQAGEKWLKSEDFQRRVFADASNCDVAFVQ